MQLSAEYRQSLAKALIFTRKSISAEKEASAVEGAVRA